MFGIKNNAVIVRFLQTHYSDSALERLLSATRRGGVDYTDLEGCLVGRADLGDNYFYHPAARAYLKFEIRYFPLTNIRFVNWRLSRLIEREMRRRTEGRNLTEALLRLDVRAEPVRALQCGAANITPNSMHVQHTRGEFKPSREVFFETGSRS